MNIANISEKSVNEMLKLNPKISVTDAVKHLGNKKYFSKQKDAKLFSRTGYVTKVRNEYKPD